MISEAQTREIVLQALNGASWYAVADQPDWKEKIAGIVSSAFAAALAERDGEIERLRTDNQNLGQGRTGWPVVIGLQQEVMALRTQRDALVEVLGNLIKWVESETVKSTFSRQSLLALTHPHLTVPVTSEFSAWAQKVWADARAAIAADKRTRCRTR